MAPTKVEITAHMNHIKSAKYSKLKTSPTTTPTKKPAIFDLVFLFTKLATPPDTAAGSIKIKNPPEEPDPPPPARAKNVKNSISMS